MKVKLPLERSMRSKPPPDLRSVVEKTNDISSLNGYLLSQASAVNNRETAIAGVPPSRRHPALVEDLETARRNVKALRACLESFE